MIIEIKNLEELEKLGIKLGSLLEKKDVICLNGDLGAGKTTFTQAIGKGLEVIEYITSPTFTIINEYEGRLPLYHFDIYRLGDEEELDLLGAQDYFYSDGVCVIEWANNVENILPKERLDIWIKIIDENRRQFKFIPHGDRYVKLVEELLK
ncbi:tRNA (adenosine(37)-N6)-threonylcarbamoyltransferase complex ATPase subunit type 1 TsaE [Soehngenia longivitae]|uniref:tRNA threonylcarbamoyladenosine biosynthesis protein TsaE n=1 Tax=Soehngenia longivitae TaxID=2562294 RepID=A0A4Z0DA00_9FIRM|nr:tRNA (adenosine(37)-N6)-threonylcarbamoyltransferase complex ATPase subunit type 1 TsaE [Soehngenia longivitae]TFZ41731.1 tRNA (adenosine(37)-N6)-threonylcarbamoyltransferase complex ATPase subunit type 1 TsaE [Soehngenia longivitae]